MTLQTDDFDDLLTDDIESAANGIKIPLTLDSLAALSQWVAWREEPNEKGKLQKRPKNPHTGNNAKSNDARTWGTRQQSERAADRLPSMQGEGARGIGIELGPIVDGRPLLLGGIDLDSCLEPKTGKLEPWAAEIINRFATYSEISPSGAGVKVFFAYSSGDLADLAGAMRNPETGSDRFRLAWSRGTHCEIGLDISNRYYTVTGQLWPDSPPTLRTVSLEDLLWVIRDAGPAFLAHNPDEANGTASRDQSGSAAAYREMMRLSAEGHEQEPALEIIRAVAPDKTGDDAAKASEWLGRTTAREIGRTWRRARDAAASMRPRADVLDDGGDDYDDLPARDPVTQRLNYRHAVVTQKGRTYIVTEQRDGGFGFGTVGDIHAFYENDRVPTEKGKTEAASRRWMRDPDRRTYPGGVTFAPNGCPRTMLNLWRGWAVEPDPAASCERFLNHVRHVVCNGDAEQSAYLLGWLAHMVQRPDEKPGVALVLRGAKGAGKDTVADYVSRMIGRRHAPTVAESSHIVGKFNARLENALLLHVQEGSWAGDRRAEGVLKYLVTSDRIEIERKGIDSINLPSVLRMFISANADWVVPASADERRWAVFEVSDRRRGNEAYFTALRAEMNGNGPAALLHYLQNYDLTGFNVRKAPETEGLRNQKIASLRNINLWWFEMLNRGTLSEFEDGDGWSVAVQLVGRGELRQRYLEWMKGRRFDGEAVEERHFGRRMRDMLPDLEDRRPSAKPGVTRVRQYEVPALADCRAAFDRWLGQPVDWELVE